MRDKRDVMRLHIQNGIRDLDGIRNSYNEFKKGGNTKKPDDGINKITETKYIQHPDQDNDWLMIKPPWQVKFEQNKPTYPDKIYLRDDREVRATTGKPLVQTRDAKRGIYNGNTIHDIIKASKDEGYDPNTALSVGLTESALNGEDGNLGHVINSNFDVDQLSKFLGDSGSLDYTSARNMVSSLKSNKQKAINNG